MKVKFVSLIDSGESGGSISFCRNIIQLAKYTIHLILGKKRKVRVSRSCHEQDFCHEMIHGIDIVYNGDTLTEKQVENLAKGLHQVIEDNPNIFKPKQGEENDGK